MEGVFSFLWTSEKNKTTVSTRGSNSASEDSDLDVTTDQLWIRTSHCHHNKLLIKNLVCHVDRLAMGQIFW